MIARVSAIEDLLRQKLEAKYSSLREQFKGVNKARDGFIDVAEVRRSHAPSAAIVPDVICIAFGAAYELHC